MLEISLPLIVVIISVTIIIIATFIGAIVSRNAKLKQFSQINDVYAEIERIKTKETEDKKERARKTERDLNIDQSILQNKLDDEYKVFKNARETEYNNYVKSNTKKRKDLDKTILDLDIEIKSKGKKKDHMELTLQGVTKALRLEQIALGNTKTIMSRLTDDLRILTDKKDMIEVGFYEPLLNLEESHVYKARLDKIRGKQKKLIKDKNAFVCHTKWEVGGSKVAGTKMTNQNIRLGLQAFNNRCDNVIIKTKWNNYDRSVERLRKSREIVEKLLHANDIHITNQYFNLKLEELELSYKYEEKSHQEREEQKEIREQMREEERVLREVDKAQKEAEKEERKYEQLLIKIRKEVGENEGRKRDKLLLQIKELEANLTEAQRNKERAKSQAELTRRGHVYIISNEGSFGKDVFKIGMTRRLDPQDRVKELSGAAVPFRFDVHAMIFTDDAPKLEKELHKSFFSNRVNRVNNRKEFFKVSIDDISNKCKELGVEAQLTKMAEAKEYHQSKTENITA